MSEIRQWWGHVWTMGHEAVVLWWRVLPKVLAVLMIARVLTNVCNVIAALLTENHAWVALMIVSTGLVITLSGIIISLRFMGQALDIDADLPEGVTVSETDPGKDESITRSIALALLPFLGIYATFDYIQKTANLLVANEIVMRGVMTHGVLDQLKAETIADYTRIGLVVVGAYIARRVVDLLHEKTGFRPLGLVAALLEGFFMLILIFSGTALLLRLESRFIVTRLASWGAQVKDGLDTTLGSISALLPGFVDDVWNFLTDRVWPLLIWSFGEPILWLAVVALVFGSHVLSLAEMWRKGEPLSAHLDDNHHLVLDKRGRRRAKAGTRGRRAVLEVQEALFGDFDDKYLPTFQSLRLMLSGGLVFLSAYVVIYSVFNFASRELHNLPLQIVGGRDPQFLVAWADLMQSVAVPLGDSLRLALLAVAFQQALRIFRGRADSSMMTGRVKTPVVGGAPNEAAPAPENDPAPAVGAQ